MKNLVFNLRTAKAQAEGCAKVTKSSRMAKVLTTLTLLLTLSVGQMWAGAGFYEVYFTYSYSGTTSNATYTNSTSTTQTIDLGTLTADFKITSIYLKYWKDGSGNMCGGLVDYYISSDQEYQPSWTWTSKGGNNHELSSTANWTIAHYNTGASGSYTFWYRFKTWGSSSSSGGCSDNYYIPTNSNNKNKFTYNIAPPAVSGFGVSTSGFLAGSGTSSDPYLVKSGNSLTFTVSGSKARTDANSTFKYWLNSGTKKTSGTLSTGSITSTSLQSATIHGQCINNSSSSLVGTESTSTIYYKAVSVKDISVYIYVGGRTDGEAQSVEMNGCIPYVGTKALSAVSIHTYNSGSSPKFTKDGNWLIYTFTNVTKVSNITCARTGGNIFTGEITDNVYYSYDGTELSGQCIPRSNPTWGTAPASGAIGGSMTATVSGAPAGATITWSSTNTSAATVNSSGVISYVAAGNTTIKARVQKAAGGDYCELDYTLSQDISVTSGATVTATRACPEYVSSNSGQVKLDISSTGASTGWYYRVCNSTKTAYYAPDEQSAASNTLSWTMNGSLPTGSNTLVVELYNSARQLVRTSSSVTVNVEIAESVTISAGANGSVSPSGIVYANNNHVHPTITATPNEHYNFVNWTSSYPSSAWVASATSATTTVTATASGYTITANFAGDQYSIEYYDQGGSAFSGTQTNPPTTHTYGTATTLKTPTKTGFTFGGWYTNSACTGASVSSLGATAYTANINLYAKWTEVMSTLTTSCHYDAGDPSYAVPTKSVSSIGISTTSNLVATAPGTGYTFVGWTLTHCVRTSGAANSRTITVRSDGSGEAASAVANYEEVLTSTYYVEGDAGGPFTYGWNANANTMMMKRTGYSTSSDVYWELEVPASKTSPGNNQWEFKIYNDASTTNEKWYGWGNGTVHHCLTKANNNLTLSTTGSNTIYLKCYVEGTYTFHVNYSTPASPTLEVSWPVVNQLRISSASPTDATNTNNFDLTDKGSNNWEVKRTLNANTTYTFKMVFDGAWYGDGTAFTRSNTSATGLTDGDNMTIKTDVAGEYTFTFNSSSKNLDITYPTAYTVTYGVGTSYTSMGSVSTSPSVTSGNYVIAGTSIRFTATPNLGYKFVGWYGNAACTGEAVSTNASYNIASLGANTTLYAKFELLTLYMNSDINNWGSAITLTHTTENPAVYTYTGTLNAKPTTDATTYATGWHFEYCYNEARTEKAYQYTTVQVPTYSGSSIDGVHTYSGANTIQFGLTRKSDITITLTLQAAPAKPTVNIAADPYYTITYGAPTHGSYTIKVGSSGAVGANTESTAGKTITLTPSPATGYHFDHWTVTKAGSGTVTVTSNRFAMPSDDVTIAATFLPTSYDVTLKANGGEGADKVVTAIYDAAMPPTLKGGGALTAHTRTGYNFTGYYDNESAGTQYYDNSVASVRPWDKASTANLFAHWTPKTTTVTFSQSGTGYGSGGQTSTVSATYDAAMPDITIPTAAAGYCFMGYYDALEPLGTQYYTSTGASAQNWNKEDADATLYAYFKKAEITAVELSASILDPVAAGGTGFIIANPTVEPTPVLPVKICWELLYDNGNSVPAGHESQAYTEGNTKPNQVRFSIAGLAAGGYKIKATLRTGDDCSGGTLLSEREVSFTIASGYTVTIQYKDTEGNTIAPSTTSPGKATDWTSISAPTIVGYNFSTWVPGDGITLESSATTNSNRFKATFNGTLTARYTKKRVIYFNNTLGWSNVYVYFYSSNKYWADNYGTGAYAGKYFDGYKPYSDQRHGHMTQIEGTNIWYFDYTAAGYDTYENIAFANMDKSNSGTDNTSNNNLGFFSNTPSDPIQVVRRGDHNASLPMFVPLAGQPKTKLNNNKAEYSNQGYWMNYPENTGYALRLFNSSGVEIDSIPFEFTPDKTMPMSVEYILDGSKTYQFKLYRTDGKWFGNNGTMKAGASGDIGETSWEFKEKDGETTRNNCRINTNAAGTYTFTLDFGNKDGYNYLIGVHYPAAANDFQILYNDNAEWSLGSTHDKNWVHPSRIIRARENGVDTISFFVAKDNKPILKARKVNSINASTGAITWGSLNISGAAKQDLTVDSSAVYNFKVTQGAAGVINSIQYIGAYTGNYYIRSSALSNKWGNYVDNLDHRMTYSSFSESDANSFGEKYSHYKAKWCPRNTNIAFCIANDYSPCITDTLKQDVGNPYDNTDINGTLNNDGVAGHSGNNAYLDRYSANVRFMWDRKTNKISRAYVSASTSTNAKFLVLQGSGATNANIYDGSTGASFAVDPPGANSVILSDNENWIYEVTVKANPSALVKLYANYCGQTQWFRGAAGGFTEGTTAIQILGGSASASQYSVRVIYDFKTNRLVCAWVPSGSSETIDTDLTVNADVMIVREHQESAQCITFSNNAKMTSVKNVYGVMRFNRWILNNRQHPEDQNKDHARADHIVEDLAEHHPPLSVGQQKSTYERRLYFISFPFDVLVGDIFGFGTYGQYWVIQYYDGLNRAKKGYWMDSKPNWKYVSPTEVAQGYKLEKNQGYILELNLKAMAADNTTFWSNGISTIELYFPSTVNQDILKQTDITIPALSDEYECTINRGTAEGDRRVKDSYWRCIGVPSYNLYNSTLKDGSGNEISWKTNYTWKEDESEFPFIYMWNKTDNTLTPQSTSAFLFQPMHAYLTQIKSAIVWTAVSAKPSSIVARRAGKEATKEYNWRIELKQDTTFLDQTYVRMTDLEQVTDSFDFGQDLIKELNSRSNIYTFIGYEKVAANSMTLHTDQTTVIPVGANITTEGDYTFALPDGADGIGVTLIDAETGTHTNLSAGMDYTVYLEKGTHDNRFWLEISPIQNTPTDIELINGENGDASLNGVRKVLIDGILYIVKDGKLFDARGARLR